MRAFVALVALLALAQPASSSHCSTWTTSLPEIDTGPTPIGRFYQDTDIDQFDGNSYWVYQESNGIDGLQRGDEIVDDTCHGMIRSDTIVF